MKHLTIWSNRNIDLDEWKESYKEFIEANELDEDPNDEYKLWDYIHEMLGYYLDDEIANLNKITEGRILAIADLGLWHGRVQGYRIFGNNVNSILRPEWDYHEWYSDGYNIKGVAVHHDGTNFYEYRVIREDRNIQNLLDAIYNGEKISRKKLNYYTKSLHPYVAKVYGW